MRDPSYPCKERIKIGVFWWRPLRFGCPPRRETSRTHQPAELAKAQHRLGELCGIAAGFLQGCWIPE